MVVPLRGTRLVRGALAADLVNFVQLGADFFAFSRGGTFRVERTDGTLAGFGIDLAEPAGAVTLFLGGEGRRAKRECAAG